MLEWRIARSSVIDYEGDLLNAPDKKKVGKPDGNIHSKNSRNLRNSESDLDD